MAGANAQQATDRPGKLNGRQVAGEVVGEPAVAVAENHQSVGLGARHGAYAVRYGSQFTTEP